MLLLCIRGENGCSVSQRFEFRGFLTFGFLRSGCRCARGRGTRQGSRGAVYIDCPMKPCFLCKMPGPDTISVIMLLSLFPFCVEHKSTVIRAVMFQ